MEDFDRFFDHWNQHEGDDAPARIGSILEALQILVHSPLIGRNVKNGKRELVTARAWRLSSIGRTIFRTAEVDGRDGGFAMADDTQFAQARDQMMAEITALVIFNCARLGKAGLNRRVLEVMADVPRHEFVPTELQAYAYADTPLPIGCGKTISQPFIVATMTDLLDPQPTDRVLDIGTGLGYQTAILSRLVSEVCTIELIESLAVRARQRLARLGCSNVQQRVGNGHLGWPEKAPFDKIIVTAAPEEIPAALIDQLAPEGRMVLPAGPPDAQQLMVVEKSADGTLARRNVLAVRFSVLEDSAPR